MVCGDCPAKEAAIPMESSMGRRLGWFEIGALLLAVSLAICLPAHGQNETPRNPFAALHFRYVGPFGNRASAVVGVPGNPSVDYIGAASGGVWKTTDGGVNWFPIFDHGDVSSIGAIAIAPSEHNLVWVGTGEPWLIRPDQAMGDGAYKSTDAGRSWQHVGLDQTGHIARIVIDPYDPNRVFACAVGQTYRAQHERGIFRTLDGGKTWRQVLFVNQDTGCSELAMDPQDPNTLFAGMWQVTIKTWNLDSGGPGSGVYVTHDGGDTWTKLSGHGLPPSNQSLGKVAVAMAPSNPNRVYALIQEGTPAFYRSDDRGKTWTLVNQHHILDERSPYYTRFAVSPDDENLLYFPCVSFTVSRDGGQTVFEPQSRPGPYGALLPGPSAEASAGGDNHDIWIDPLNPSRIMVANDAGVSISLNHGASYESVVLPIAQMYQVATDNDVPYHVMGDRQDGYSYRAPSRTLYDPDIGANGVTTGEWISVGGCESGFSLPDPTNPDIIWSGCYNGMLTRMDLRTGQARNVSVWPAANYGWAPADVKYRWHWTFPIAISPEDHNRVYIGSQYVHETNDGGQTWKVISPDLTLNNKSHEQSSGGISGDNLMTFDGATLYALAESPVKPGVIWAGSNDGQVNVTRDGGTRWVNVTKSIPKLPPWGTVTSIEPSAFDSGTAYISVDLQQVGDYSPYIYKTTDYGQTWTMIGSDIPKSVSSFVHCVIEDPVRKGMLFAGTDNALYVSWDDGEHWTRLRNNLPPVPVYWLTIQKKFNDLVIATYGRGIYILDDITPLREWQQAPAQPVYFFKPRPAYRFRHVEGVRYWDAGSHVIGENPPYGADLNFYSKSPEKNVEFEILGPGKEVIRTLKLEAHVGLNRLWWDLRYGPAETVKLLTSPPGEPWVKVGPEGWRPLIVYTNIIYDPMLGPIVEPGVYTVRLKIGQQEFNESLEVLPDPHSLGTPQSIRANVQFQLEVLAELNQVTAMINPLEQTKKQLGDLDALLAAKGPEYASVIQASHALEQKALGVEDKLFDVELTGRIEDSFRNPMRIYGRLYNMMQFLDEGAGVVGSGADLGPTADESAVNDMLKGQIAEARTEFDQFRTKTTPAFNALLSQRGLTVSIEP
jgi:photosystem II stability/assembly factor-like uncharacterized protein